MSSEHTRGSRQPGRTCTAPRGRSRKHFDNGSDSVVRRSKKAGEDRRVVNCLPDTVPVTYRELEAIEKYIGYALDKIIND